MTAVPNEDWHSRDTALGLLSLAAGGMDSLAFLTLGEVFTSAMSGNTILFGLAVGEGRLLAASHSMVAFVGYVGGVAVAAPALSGERPAVARILAVETLLLAAFASCWTWVDRPADPPAVYILILLSALGMGLQGAIARHLRVPGIMTIVFTNTLTSVVGTLAERARAGQRPLMLPQTWRQLAMFLVYLGSAVLTALLMRLWPAVPPFLPVICVLLVLGGMAAGRLRLDGE